MVLVALLLAFTLMPAASAFGADTRAELNAAKKRLEALRGDFDQVKERLAELNSELQVITLKVAKAVAQKEELEEAIAEATSEIQASRDEATELQDNLNARAREAYIRGPAGAFELILEADSLVDLSDRASFLDVLSRADANLATGLQVERRQIAGFRSNLVAYRDRVERLLDELQGDAAELETKQAEVQAAQTELDDKIAEGEEAVEKLEKKLQRQYLERYGITGGGTMGPPVGADGPLYWCPVDPPRSYIETFGAPRPGGRTHMGNDIFAPYGTSIRSPFDGLAEEGSNSLGGYTVNVHSAANADYVYNAHMSRYAGVDGQQVKAGDVIGFVGDSGNAAGTPPHDHFEYHPGGGSAVTPYLYLNEVCGTNGS